MKRVLSLFLSVLMLTSVAAAVDLSAYAASGSSTSNAISLSFDSTKSGNISENQDTVYYKFTLSSSGCITLDLTSYLKWIGFTIYDDSTNEITNWGFDINSTLGLTKDSATANLTKGTYYLVVTGVRRYYSTSYGNYSFSLSFKSASESFSETTGGTNNSYDTASAISLGKTYKGQIAINDETDIYKFKLTSTGRVDLKIKSYLNWIGFTIYDDSTNFIKDWGFGINDTLGYAKETETVYLTKGTYYLVVTGVRRYYSTSFGNYNFSVSKHSHSYSVTSKATTDFDGLLTCSTCGEATKTVKKIKTVKLSCSSYTYNGKSRKPTVTVKDSKGNKIDSKYYTVSYVDRSTGKTLKSMKNVGQYYVKVKFKGRYSGTVKKSVKIKPKATSIKKVSANKKGFTVKWNKQASKTSGYQIQYSTSSSFKNAKTVTVSKNSTTSKKVTGLKAKKKYYVRVRTYKTVKINGKSTKVYSSWSSKKSVTTKR